MISVHAKISNPNFDKVIAKELKEFTGKVRKAAKKAVRKTTNTFYKKVFENLSLRMHGAFPGQHYDVLAKRFNYPFSATKHVGIRMHGHNPVWAVHRVYGIMRRQLHKKVESTMNAEIGSVGWLYGHSPHVEWVIKGTGKMLPRPVLFLTSRQIDLQKVLVDNFLKHYNKIKVK